MTRATKVDGPRARNMRVSRWSPRWAPHDKCSRIISRCVVGAGGITGTITTNGATGTLSIGDIVAWNLTVSDGTQTFNLYGGDSTGYVNGLDLLATATQLLFNFSDSAGGYLFFQSPTSGVNGPYACFISSASGCYETNAIVLEPAIGADSPSNPFARMSGTQVIGSVPEPSIVLLVCMEFAVLLAIFRRRMVCGHSAHRRRETPPLLP